MASRVLIVDDTEDIRAIASMALELDPTMEVRTCGSGAEGLQIAEWWQPDLILLDVQMPGLSGPDTLKILRSGGGKAASTPVIFFTASVQKDDKEKTEGLIQLGAQGLILKPFDPMALGEQIQPFLSHSIVNATPLGDEGESLRTPDHSSAPDESERSLLYVSRSLLGEEEIDSAILKIVATARSKNEHRDVTGALISTGTHFAQYLEGPATAVDQLLATIRQDTRHTDICIAAVPPFTRRYFANWTMAYGGSSEFISNLVANVFDNPSETSGPEKLIRLMRELTNNAGRPS